MIAQISIGQLLVWFYMHKDHWFGHLNELTYASFWMCDTLNIDLYVQVVTPVETNNPM